MGFLQLFRDGAETALSAMHIELQWLLFRGGPFHMPKRGLVLSS